jgi:hypothetical protein
MSQSTRPPLAAPGAGLPPVEHLVARLLFGLRRATGSRRSFTAKFQLEREKIGALVREFDAHSAARRVLIPRPPGLEDSSRDWSVWMTLDHLRIVHLELIRIIGDLTSGRVPQGEVSTAAVKPSPEVDGSVIASYEESCDALLTRWPPHPISRPACALPTHGLGL